MVNNSFVRGLVFLRFVVSKYLVLGLVTRDALKGHTVSKNVSISFYAGCPEGPYRV